MEAEPPLGWPSVYAFEEANGVVLPEPYRTFVATVTAGGRHVGPPAYGLVHPGRLPDDWPAEWRIAAAESFPLEEAWIWEGAEHERDDGISIHDVFTRGIVPLGTDGCGIYWALVVTGSQRGHVWELTDCGAQPFGREFGYTTGASGFLGWVEHWHSGAEWWNTAPDQPVRD
jgi:hypothetical protein